MAKIDDSVKKKVPELRFKGFTDDWEERKVGDFLTESKIAGSNGAEANKLTVKLWSKGVVPKSEVYQGSEATQYYIRKAGQFMYGKLDFLNQAFGIVPEELNGYESTLDSPAFDFSENLNSYFFLEYVSRKSFYQYQGMIANGSRKAKRIHSDTFFDMPLILPLKREQDKIAEFIINLDRTIALHQRKLDLLKEQKKGYLQKMFPKNGAKVPELRFAGFADDWEERKLKELGDIQTGNTPPTSDSDNYSLDGVLWVTPTDIKSLVISNTAKKLSQVGVTKARIAKAGSILVTSIASIGKNTLLRMDAGFNQQINSLTPTSENDSYFLLTQSEKWSEKMKQTAASATMQIVNKTDFSNISTYVPVHKEEQEKIGSFFKQLDETIALHQRKLDLLKEQKKGFLQKMFV